MHPSASAALDLPPQQQPCEIRKYACYFMVEEELRHWEIRWLGLFTGHWRSWGQTMDIPSWTSPPLVAHVDGWAERTWEHPLPGGFEEVSGVGKCIHLSPGVYEPSRKNKKPYISFVGGCCLKLSYSFVIYSQRTSWCNVLTVNPEGFKPSGPESCGVLLLYHHSLIYPAL